MKVAIIKYNSGNIQSVKFALNRIGIEPILTDSLEEIQSADKVIFPGVGEASGAMKYLNEKGLNKIIPNLKQPLLGICLGMQLMCKYSEEGNTNCLNIFTQKVFRFSPFSLGRAGPGSKIPQIGWNNIFNLKTKLFEGIAENEYQYFVHSYYVELGDCAIATTNYITEYSSALQKDNFYGVQFHPEKSAKAGEQILKNFIEL
ncbi:MAG TPA: imidazole glycerol phosphate synthase subunit HisH [Bacteroidia bacterium]|jgi:glutamine amidotransferase|nr:imidazole glycerol phosphate synthase subunit HisH [Bacteroidia bacterium]